MEVNYNNYYSLGVSVPQCVAWSCYDTVPPRSMSDSKFT